LRQREARRVSPHSLRISVDDERCLLLGEKHGLVRDEVAFKTDCLEDVALRHFPRRLLCLLTRLLLWVVREGELRPTEATLRSIFNELLRRLPIRVQAVAVVSCPLDEKNVLPVLATERHSRVVLHQEFALVDLTG